MLAGGAAGRPRCDGARPAPISKRARARRIAVEAARLWLRLRLFAYLIMRFGISVSGFVPKTYCGR